MKFLERVRRSKILGDALAEDGWSFSLDFCNHCHKRGGVMVRNDECWCLQCKKGEMWPDTVHRIEAICAKVMA